MGEFYYGDGDIEALKAENAALRSALEKAEERCRLLRDGFREARDKLDAARDLNEGLKRICRERANAARGLSPKKERSGYLVLSTGQWDEVVSVPVTFEEWRRKYPDRNLDRFIPEDRQKIMVWKSIVQTPYQAVLSYDSVKDEIYYDILWELADQMGIKGVQEWEKNGTYYTWELFPDSGPVCVLYKWHMRANLRAGYWELELYTSHPVTVPEDLCPGWISS